uniref:CC2-LZ domain-containing protein n=1 Tax=Macrostomum lignano TaxID=282301 RepID=A0A1I8ISV1_9PLAT
CLLGQSPDSGQIAAGGSRRCQAPLPPGAARRQPRPQLVGRGASAAQRVVNVATALLGCPWQQQAGHLVVSRVAVERGRSAQKVRRSQQLRPQGQQVASAASVAFERRPVQQSQAALVQAGQQARVRIRAALGPGQLVQPALQPLEGGGQRSLGDSPLGDRGPVGLLSPVRHRPAFANPAYDAVQLPGRNQVRGKIVQLLVIERPELRVREQVLGQVAVLVPGRGAAAAGSEQQAEQLRLGVGPDAQVQRRVAGRVAAEKPVVVIGVAVLGRLPEQLKVATDLGDVAVPDGLGELGVVHARALLLRACCYPRSVAAVEPNSNWQQPCRPQSGTASMAICVEKPTSFWASNPSLSKKLDDLDRLMMGNFLQTQLQHERNGWRSSMSKAMEELERHRKLTLQLTGSDADGEYKLQKQFTDYREEEEEKEEEEANPEVQSEPGEAEADSAETAQLREQLSEALEKASAASELAWHYENFIRELKSINAKLEARLTQLAQERRHCARLLAAGATGDEGLSGRGVDLYKAIRELQNRCEQLTREQQHQKPLQAYCSACGSAMSSSVPMSDGGDANGKIIPNAQQQQQQPPHSTQRDQIVAGAILGWKREFAMLVCVGICTRWPRRFAPPREDAKEKAKQLAAYEKQVMPAKTSVTRCLRCQKLYRLVDNNKFACKYHSKGRQRVEQHSSQG